MLGVGSLWNGTVFFQCLDPKVTILQEACKMSEASIRSKQVSVHASCEGCRRHGITVDFSAYRRGLESCQEEIEGLSQPTCSHEVKLQKAFEDLLKKKV
jgi:hypothetical protein